jgi:hypothetical protein
MHAFAHACCVTCGDAGSEFSRIERHAADPDVSVGGVCVGAKSRRRGPCSRVLVARASGRACLGHLRGFLVGPSRATRACWIRGGADGSRRGSVRPACSPRRQQPAGNGRMRDGKRRPAWRSHVPRRAPADACAALPRHAASCALLAASSPVALHSAASPRARRLRSQLRRRQLPSDAAGQARLRPGGRVRAAGAMQGAGVRAAAGATRAPSHGAHGSRRRTLSWCFAALAPRAHLQRAWTALADARAVSARSVRRQGNAAVAASRRTQHHLHMPLAACGSGGVAAASHVSPICRSRCSHENAPARGTPPPRYPCVGARRLRVPAADVSGAAICGLHAGASQLAGSPQRAASAGRSPTAAPVVQDSCGLPSPTASASVPGVVPRTAASAACPASMRPSRCVTWSLTERHEAHTCGDAAFAAQCACSHRARRWPLPGPRQRPASHANTPGCFPLPSLEAATAQQLAYDAAAFALDGPARIASSPWVAQMWVLLCVPCM